MYSYIDRTIKRACIQASPTLIHAAAATAAAVCLYVPPPSPSSSFSLLSLVILILSESHFVPCIPYHPNVYIYWSNAKDVHRTYTFRFSRHLFDTADGARLLKTSYIYISIYVQLYSAWWQWWRGGNGSDDDGGGGDVVLMLGSGMPLCTVVCVSMAKR